MPSHSSTHLIAVTSIIVPLVFCVLLKTIAERTNVIVSSGKIAIHLKQCSEHICPDKIQKRKKTFFFRILLAVFQVHAFNISFHLRCVCLCFAIRSQWMHYKSMVKNPKWLVICKKWFLIWQDQLNAYRISERIFLCCIVL